MLTPKNRQLRAAYVAHTVSKLVTYRVFGPFLFSLGRRYDKADSLFATMSSQIRDKSTRKEAIWRQQTLLSAFTSSGAKQRINTAAGTVVEEIVNAIKNFADPKEEDSIKIAVKRIIKLAAETWRFARLEREMITATMPTVQDEEHQFTGPDFWQAHRPEGTPIASLVGSAPPSDERPRLLLRLFPVIHREPKHENFRESDDEMPDEGCIYHHGLALYDDAEPVILRAEELKAAGLPPTASASPTATDFPPPLLPAPRNPVPPTPELDSASDADRIASPPPQVDSDNASTRSRVPPVVPPSRRTSGRFGFIPHPTRSPPPVPIKPASIRSGSIRSQTPSSANPSEAPGSPEPTYTRPPPGPIDFDTPRDIPHPNPTEVSSEDTEASPMPTDETASVAPSASLAVLAAEYADGAPPLPAPTESAIIPPFDPSASNLQSRPGSRSENHARPVSPLFAAIDEIDALSSHRSRNTSTSRRSTRSKPSDEELKDDASTKDKDKDKEKDKDSSRRVSGYSLGTSRSADSGSPRADGADRPERPGSGSRNSRYLCESRSAAIKGLYPNSPLAGSPNISRTNSLRSQKRKSEGAEGMTAVGTTVTATDVRGTWDTDSNETMSIEAATAVV